MSDIYLIKKLWYDPLENLNAYGYNDLGYVTTLDEVNQILSSKPDLTPEGWPLKYANSGKPVPVYKFYKLDKL